METRFALFIFFSSLLLTLPGRCDGSRIGVCYGRNGDDLPEPEKVAQLVQLHKIKYVRIYDSNPQVLKAFSGTGVDLMIGIPNSDLLSFSQFQSNADTWLKTTVLPYYPAVKISYITVGAEVTEFPNISSLVVPAMRNVFTALTKAGLQRKIKVSSTHSLNILSRSFPPSAGAFSSRYASFLKPMLDFLADTESPFLVNVYPYFSIRDSPARVPLRYATFEPSPTVVDPNTGLLYTNLFDAQVDAVYYALAALSFGTVTVVVSETGWPTKGSRADGRGVSTVENAQTYNTNLIRHVIKDIGTPGRPGREVGVYVFALFNENRKPGLESERNWGLFYPDQTSEYSLDFTGRGGVDMTTVDNITGAEGTWCVASSKASVRDLQTALDWACGPGKVDCSAIQPSRSCFEPDNVASHASYAFNGYFQLNGATDIACSFGGFGRKVVKDPSYDKCLYLKFGSNQTASMSKNLTAAINSHSSFAIRIFPSFSPLLFMTLLSFSTLRILGHCL